MRPDRQSANLASSLSQQSPEDDKWHSGCLLFQKSQCCGAELRDPRQGNVAVMRALRTGAIS